MFVLHPSQGGQLVEQPEIGDVVAEEQEALGGQPVVDGHAHDTVRANPTPQYSATDPDPFMNEPPWIQTSTGSRPFKSGPHVEVQAVLALDDHLGEQRGVLRRIVTLRHRRPVRGGVAFPIPTPGQAGVVFIRFAPNGAAA